MRTGLGQLVRNHLVESLMRPQLSSSPPWPPPRRPMPGQRLPGAPTGVMATPGNASAVVSWTAPKTEGGSSIGLHGDDVPWWPNLHDHKDHGLYVHGLANGATFSVTVKAKNAKGFGPSSGHVSAKPGVPLAPSTVCALAGNAGALVSWKAPADNGGAVIRYTATSHPGSFTCGTAATSCTVNGLANNIGYTFTVVASNAHGSGRHQPVRQW